MKFYANRILINYRGKEFLDGPTEEKSVPLTLGNLACDALMREFQPDHNAPSSAKLLRGRLARAIAKHAIDLKYNSPSLGPDLDRVKKLADTPMLLSTEEVALIKSRIAMGFPASIVLAAEEAIEGTDPFEGDEMARIGG